MFGPRPTPESETASAAGPMRLRGDLERGHEFQAVVHGSFGDFCEVDCRVSVMANGPRARAAGRARQAWPEELADGTGRITFGAPRPPRNWYAWAFVSSNRAFCPLLRRTRGARRGGIHKEPGELADSTTPGLS